MISIHYFVHIGENLMTGGGRQHTMLKFCFSHGLTAYDDKCSICHHVSFYLSSAGSSLIPG